MFMAWIWTRCRALMLCVYSHYKYFHSYSSGRESNVDRCQILTSEIAPRSERVILPATHWQHTSANLIELYLIYDIEVYTGVLNSLLVATL